MIIILLLLALTALPPQPRLVPCEVAFNRRFEYIPGDGRRYTSGFL